LGVSAQMAEIQRTHSGRSSIAPPEQQTDAARERLGLRAEARRELRVRLAPRDWQLVARLCRAYDTSASGLVRAAIRQLGVQLDAGGTR